MSSYPFTNLPHVPVPQELLDRAFGRAARVTYEDKHGLWKARRLTAAKLQSATENLNQPLVKVVKGFPSIDRLHPFYIEIVDLTVGLDGLKKALGALDWARKEVLEIGNTTAQRALRIRYPKQAEEIIRHVYGRLASIVRQISPSLELLRTARSALRRLPAVEVDLPICVVCGAPNVGKSSLVRVLSTGKPEVAAYPFTTKEVSLGHIPHRYVNLQLMDTPGLLDRPDAERNEVERQAAAALAHLDPVILFVLDPSGHCGYPLEDQLSLRASLRAEFPDQPWLEAWAKSDISPAEIAKPISAAEEEKRAVNSELEPAEGALAAVKVSATTGAGLEELKAKLVGELDTRLRAMAAAMLMSETN